MAPGPYAQPPAMPPQMPPPMLPPVGYGAQPTTDTKATLSLILGLLSFLCCTGIFTAIPAIVLGFMSRRDIARSGGALGGEGLALGGIITGGLSTLGTVVYLLFIVGMGTYGAVHSPSTPPPYVSYPTPPPPPTAYTPPLSVGAIHVVELSPGSKPLIDQLTSETRASVGVGETPLVYLYAHGAAACDEFDASLPAPVMQKALARARLIRVEATLFKRELATLGYDKPTYPWLLRVAQIGLGKNVTIVEAISGDEWEDNEPAQIAPVLASFLRGGYVPHAKSAEGHGLDAGADAGRAKPKGLSF